MKQILFLATCLAARILCNTAQKIFILTRQLETSRFVRNGTTEIEYYKAQVDTADIRWVNDCECILTKRNPTSNQDKRPIQIKILTTQKNTYTFEYSLVGDAKNKKRGTIKKIK